MATKPVTDASFEEEVIKSKKPILVDAWATWCNPCLQLSPILEEISEEMKDKINILKINADENPLTIGNLGIRGLPTMVIFKDGLKVATKVGAVSKPIIVEWIEESIS